MTPDNESNNESQRNDGAIVPVRRELPASVPPGPLLPLGASREVLDLTGLTEEQIQALRVKHAEMSIETDSRIKNVAADVRALDVTLQTMSKHTRETASAGQHITITKTHQDALGRVEMIMGNTPAAASGKLTRSQEGRGSGCLGLILFVLLVIGIAVAAAWVH